MPIRPEFRQFYRPSIWQPVRKRILERAGNKCEECRVPNHVHALRNGGNSWEVGERWYSPDGLPPRAWRKTRLVKIVLTVAHLNHTPGDDRDENLKALCQWDHLHYDRARHIHSAHKTRATRKDEKRPLLAGSTL